MGKTNTSKSYVIFLLLRLQICNNQVCTQTLSFTIYSLKKTNLAPKICFLLKIPLHFFFSKSLFNPLLFNYKTQYLCDFVNGLSLSAQKPNLTKHTLLQNMRLFWIRFPSFFLFFLVSSYISEAQRPPMRSTTNLAPFKI